MSVKIRTIKDIRLYLAEELAEFCPGAEISALSTIIVKTLFRVTKLHSLAMPDDPVSGKQAAEVIRICRELRTGKPIQYILGETSFYNCRIKVTSDTLIPRPETEELVDLVIKENKGFSGTILDAGTGSGCIAIALSINLPGTKVTGIDISEAALAISAENARLNRTRVSFLKADILNIDPGILTETDIIVSNPPYVRLMEKKYISRNVTEFEPWSALFVPDSDPLLYYRAILNLAGRILTPQGKVYFEINEALGNDVASMMRLSGLSNVEIIKDINGKDRVAKGRKNG